MRRPHVYERTAPRARSASPIASADYTPAARAVLDAVPDLLRQAEAAGAVVLARYLGQALSEAEGIVRRAAEQDRATQDRAWTNRLGITRQ